MARSTFSVIAVVSEDGFIAKHPRHTPAQWASAGEQRHFVARMDALDWAIMGRHTHEAAYREGRRRVVFSSGADPAGWRTDNHYWCDPARQDLESVLAVIAPKHGIEDIGILGGTRVYDWFLCANLIDRIELSIEPVAFGEGLPLFSQQPRGDVVPHIEALGFSRMSTCQLDINGTWLIQFERCE